MSAASQAAGLAALEDYEWMEANAQKIRATRARLTDELIRLGFSVPPSQSNFVLAEWTGTPPARRIFEALREMSQLDELEWMKEVAEGGLDGQVDGTS